MTKITEPGMHSQLVGAIFNPPLTEL